MIAFLARELKNDIYVFRCCQWADVVWRDLLGKANYLNYPKRNLVTLGFCCHYFTELCVSAKLSAFCSEGPFELNSDQQQRQE